MAMGITLYGETAQAQVVDGAGLSELIEGTEIKMWLASCPELMAESNSDKYGDLLHGNGYGSARAIADVAREDLRVMGVARGHIGIVMSTIQKALIVNYGADNLIMRSS